MPRSPPVLRSARATSRLPAWTVTSWHVQEVTIPMPGWHTFAVAAFDSVAGLADALRRAAAVHGKYEETGHADPGRPDWCARYMVDESARGDAG